MTHTTHLSKNDSTSDSTTSPSPVLKISFTIIIILLLFLIGTGNGLVLLVIRRSQKLRGHVYQLISSLAVADFMVSIALIFYAVSYVTVLDDVPKSVLCYVVYTIVTLSTMASCTNLVFIAIDRSISINLPLRYDALITERTLKGMILAAWGIAFLPTAMIYIEPRDHWIIPGTCSFGKTLETGTETYVITHFTISLFLMTAIYSQIYFVARSHSKRIETENAAKQTDNKALVMLGIVVGSFVICYLPLTVTLIVQLFQPMSRNTALAAYFVTLFNSCLNPVIYVWKNKRMRKEMLELVCAHRMNKNQNGPSSVTSEKKVESIS